MRSQFILLKYIQKETYSRKVSRNIRNLIIIQQQLPSQIEIGSGNN